MYVKKMVLLVLDIKLKCLYYVYYTLFTTIRVHIDIILFLMVLYCIKNKIIPTYLCAYCIMK